MSFSPFCAPVTLHLYGETAKRLNEAAIGAGVEPDEIVLQMLNGYFSETAGHRSLVSFHAWLQGRRHQIRQPEAPR